MAESSCNTSVVDDAGLFKEQFAHVEELLISSREECIEIGSKYQDLSLKVENIINLQESTSSNDSGESEHVEDEKEAKYQLEELVHEYETRKSAYQQNQEHQARIVMDLQSRVEEYRIRCAKLEAAIAEQSAHEASIAVTESHSHNVLSMDLETALIRLEQEKNRCQSLTQINGLLREQLETATDVNQKLTSDVQCLTKEWQRARAELISKETEWKEEEQSFSFYFTKESNILLSLWRQVLNFKHDFSTLRNFTERELSSFKVCICHSIQNVNDVQNALASRLQNVQVDSDSTLHTKILNTESGYGKSENAFEVTRLQERISDLIDRNDRIQKLLDDKEKSNTVLCSTVEKINETLNQTVNQTHLAVKNSQQEKLCNQYSKAMEDIFHILLEDGNCETSSLLLLEDSSLHGGSETISSANPLHLQSIVSAVKKTLHKYSKQTEEYKVKLASSKEQNVIQQRTVEFLEDERQKIQQMNSQLSLQFESLNMKMQDFLQEMRSDDTVSSKHTNALETTVKSLNEQLENLRVERDRLTGVREELHSKLQTANEEKRTLKQSEQSLTLEVERSARKITALEKNVEALRKDYQSSQETLLEISLSKELLEQEKTKFTTDLSNLEHQCSELKLCLKDLRDEESFVKDSLVALQNASENLSLENSDLSKSLEKATTELEALKSSQSNAKIDFEREKLELKLQIEKLQDKCLELESERDMIQNRLQSIEESKRDAEDEKSQITIRNNDLTNQVTKYTSQKKNIEVELEQVREELELNMKLVDKANQESNSLTRAKAELSVKLESMESEIDQLNEVILALKDEKVNLEKSLYAAQQHSIKLLEDNTDLVRNLDIQQSSTNALQGQIKDLQELHEKFVDDVAREKNAFLLKMQEIEQEFQISLKNERQQHNVDIENLTEEKAALRSRMVTAIDELFERHQKQQDELLSNHQEEVALLKKQISSHEREYDDKILLLKAESKKIHNDYKLQISSFEETIKALKYELEKKEEVISRLEEKIADVDRDRTTFMQEHSESVLMLKDELNTLNMKHSNEISNMQKKMNTLIQEKEFALSDVKRLELRLKEAESDRNKIAEELDERNLYYQNEKGSKDHLEDRLSLIQNQLSDEQCRSEVISKSLEECKNRLKIIMKENSELKKQVEDAHQEMNDKVASSGKFHAQNAELRITLREVEKSRQEVKREVHSLKRSVSSLEKSVKSKDQEISDLNSLHSREEEIQEGLKKEIVLLKQKIMEWTASSEALSKELVNSKQKSSDFEHKLKMQQEQHQSLLQECLSSEQNLSEHRLNLERSMADANREVQNLRLSLNFEEGKVLALESKVVKMDGAKREVENKFYSMCLFLRSILGLGSDSGFLSVSTNLHSSSIPSRTASSEKLLEGSRTSVRESPHRSRSKCHSPAQFSASDLDVELLKSSLMDLMQKFNAAEKERDELKDAIGKLQKEDDELRAEHSRCISKTYQLKRDLDDKKNVEKELATKIASVHHCEEVIRTLEREKRRLTERIGSAEFLSTSASREKDGLHDKLSELKQNQIKLQEKIDVLTSAKESAESRALKYIKAYQSLDADLTFMKDTLANKDQELKSMEQKADAISKKLKLSDSQNKSLQSTVDHMSSELERHIQNEKLLKQKVSNLNNLLSQNSSSHQNLYEEIEKKQKESLKHQTELFEIQQSNEKLRTSVEEYQSKSRILLDEVEDLKRSLAQSDEMREELQEQLRKYRNLLFTSQNSEKEAALEVEKLEGQKQSLEEKARNLSASLRTTKEEMEEKNELCRKLEKENANFKKSFDKVEKEKARSSEMTAKSMMERSSLGKSLRQMEVENQTLQQRVQNLQAQLAELEERHSQRVKDFLKTQSIESKLEDNRLRTALKQAEELMEAREKTHRQKVLGLEEQIAVLKNHLEQEQRRWQQYHQRSLSSNTNISYLQSVLSKSLQNVSDDPQKLLPEAERLDLTTETELSLSQGISLSTPSKLRRSGVQKTSTPKAKRQLNLSSCKKS